MKQTPELRFVYTHLFLQHIEFICIVMMHYVVIRFYVVISPFNILEL